MRIAAFAFAAGCLLGAGTARAQTSGSSSFGEPPPEGTDAEAEQGGQLDAAGRELGPYVRPPYQPPAERRRGHSKASRRRQSPYNHDGFYLRLAAGVGGGVDRLEGSFPDYGFPDEDGRAGRTYSFAVPNELAVGYTVVPGVVVGAGIYDSVWLAPKADARGPLDYEFATSQMALLGPTVDAYPLPRKGWHVQGSLGVATLNMGFGSTGFATPRPAQAHVTVGGGFALGAGYEWFVAEQWSVGFLLRMMRGWSEGNDAEGGSWTHRSATYGALATVTFH